MSNIEPEESTFGPFEDLESQQYKKLYAAYDVPLIDDRKQHNSLFLITGLIILLLVVLLSATLMIPNYLKVPIEIENVEKDMVAMFSHSVKVDNFMANVGDTLRENQKICKISAPEIQSLISEIQSSRSELTVLKNIDTLEVDLRINNLANEIDNKRNLLTALALEKNSADEMYLSKKTALTAEVEYFKNIEKANKRLFDSGVISKFEYLKIQQNLINKTEELASLVNESDQKAREYNFRAKVIKGEINEISNSQNELTISYQSQRSKLEERIELALNKLKLFYGNFEIMADGLVLLSPKDGMLTYCYPDKNLLQSGEILYRLESSKGDFEGKGYVKADKIGYLKNNLSSKVMLSTFPHYEWGNLTGIVSNISTSPNEFGSYAFKIKFTENNPKIGPLLQNGQTGNGYILIEQKTLLGYLKRSLNKTTDNVLY